MKKNEKKADKRQIIFDATLELIAEHGFHNTPTSKIAKKAGIGVGSIYRYFKDKDELIHELYHYLRQKEFQEVYQEFDDDVPIREQYIRLFTKMVLYVLSHKTQTKFMEQYFNSPYGVSRRRNELLYFETKDAEKPPIFQLFEKAKELNIMKDLPLNILGALTIGPLILWTRDIHAGILEYDAKQLNEIIEACWDAVKR